MKREPFYTIGLVFLSYTLKPVRIYQNIRL